MRDIGAALRTHVRLEETVFYPVVMRVRSEEAKLSVRDALEDHHVLDGLAAELEQLEPEDVAPLRGAARMRDRSAR